MTLVQIEIKGVTMTAQKVSENFAVHPTITYNPDADTPDFELSSAVWDLEHLPSSQLISHVYQDDPVEFPGEPRAVDLAKVREFAAWLETLTDWSSDKPDLSGISDEARRCMGDFKGNPNYWEAVLA